mmetsp:Transcript_133792/g.317056  ORF Transcript_133792/g.317056 Transcript_133792/m.317056 type:complete len:216 (-) Transcript_133792:776-1423(-)
MAVRISFSICARFSVEDAWRKSVDILSFSAFIMALGISCSTWVLRFFDASEISFCTFAFCLASKSVWFAWSRTSSCNLSSEYLRDVLASGSNDKMAACNCWMSSLLAALVSLAIFSSMSWQLLVRVSNASSKPMVLMPAAFAIGSTASSSPMLPLMRAASAAHSASFCLRIGPYCASARRSISQRSGCSPASSLRHSAIRKASPVPFSIASLRAL